MAALRNGFGVEVNKEQIVEKKWYVVHAFSGMEKSVAKDLQERIDRANMQDSFGEILVPVEEVVEIRKGQKSISVAFFSFSSRSMLLGCCRLRSGLEVSHMAAVKQKSLVGLAWSSLAVAKTNPLVVGLVLQGHAALVLLLEVLRLEILCWVGTGRLPGGLE